MNNEINQTVEFKLSGDLMEQLTEWYQYQTAIMPILGVGWIAIVIQVQAWIASDSGLADEILTNPKTGAQFRFTGYRQSDQCKIKLQLIGCLNDDGLN